jgi:ABC-2 type transport system permease protein
VIGALLRRQWRLHRAALAWLALGMLVFEFLITKLSPAVGRMQGLLDLLPPVIQEVFGAELRATLSPSGFLAFGWVHPFALLMLGVWVVRVAAGSLAGEIGRGTMDLVASRPVTRAAVVAAAALTLFAGLALLCLSGWSGIALGLAQRPLGGARAADLVGVVVSCWLLFAAAGGLALAVSALRRDGGSAIAIASGLLAASFAFDFVARTWQPLVWARPLSLFSYYAPQRIVALGMAAGDVLALAVVIVASLALAFVAFQWRDL